MTLLQSGDKAPAFNLPATTGANISLDSLKGKKVVLYFYPKDDTPGCTKEACSFRDAEAKLQQAGLVVLGVSADDLDSHRQFIDKYHLNFPLLADTDKQVINAYGVWGEKVVAGNTTMGVIRKTFLIDETGNVQKAWHKVEQPENHAEEVMAAANS